MIEEKIVLINPPAVNGMPFTREGRCQEREDVLGTVKPPFSLALLAALLRERKIAFQLFDATAENLTTQDVIERLESQNFHPSLILFPTTTPTISWDVKEMTKLKKRFGSLLAGFGPQTSCAPQETLKKYSSLDLVIMGEPEETVLQLVRSNSKEQWSEIRGLCYRNGDQIFVHSERGQIDNLDELPCPAWDLLPLQKYSLPLVRKSYVLVETSRGCSYVCDFCVVPYHHGNKFRHRSPQKLVDEIEFIKGRHGLEYFYLWGDTVTLNSKIFQEFCQELIRRDLQVRWFANARADNLVNLDYVNIMKESGCWMLSMGIESYSDEIRKDMVKRLEMGKIKIAFKNLRQVGIKSFAFFIYGYPGDTVESMDKTTEFALELDPDFANFYPAVPYPETELYNKVVREGLLKEEDWSRMEYSYYLLEGHGLNEKIVLGAIRRARRRFFLRPKFFMRQIPELVSSRPALLPVFSKGMRLLGERIGWAAH